MILKNERVVASALFQVEVRNAFWKYVQADMMTPRQAEDRIAAAIDIVDEFVPIEENAAESFAEAVRQRHSVYDLFYLTLARRNVATLLTADRRLAALCDRMGVNCADEVDF